mmetsp:Transcript_34929/g.104535  ORF Transcript_34929/g.104535 Transcript_34929/m.104535 type:complete len:205 (+) Transcript_34929:24-638(+)
MNAGRHASEVPDQPGAMTSTAYASSLEPSPSMATVSLAPASTSAAASCIPLGPLRRFFRRTSRAPGPSCSAHASALSAAFLLPPLLAFLRSRPPRLRCDAATDTARSAAAPAAASPSRRRRSCTMAASCFRCFFGENSTRMVDSEGSAMGLRGKGVSVRWMMPTLIPLPVWPRTERPFRHLSSNSRLSFQRKTWTGIRPSWQCL